MRVRFGWRANLSMAKVEVERTRGVPFCFAENREDPMGGIGASIGTVSGRFFPIRGGLNDAGSKFDFTTISKENPFFRGKNSVASPSLLFEEIIMKSRLFYGDARATLFR